MAGHPSTGELVAAVREFLAGLALTGRDAFHAKVAANTLTIVERELAGDADGVEAAALRSFALTARYVSPSPRRGHGSNLRIDEGVVGSGRGDDPSAKGNPGPGVRRGDKGEVGDLRAKLCAAIRADGLSAATPGLLDALIVATCARLTIDNPRYPTRERLMSPSSADPAGEQEVSRR